MCYRPLYMRGRVCVLRVCNHPMPVASLASTAIAISAPALTVPIAIALAASSSAQPLSVGGTMHKHVQLGL